MLAAVTGASRWFALLQIADLGVASFKTWSKLTKEEHNEQRKAGGSAGKSGGTLHYMAPEHLNDVNSRPSEKSDVFSFAIVLWAIFANKEPYESKASIEEGAWGPMGVVSGVEMSVGPAGFSGRCTRVSVPLRVVPSPTGLPSKRGPGSDIK